MTKKLYPGRVIAVRRPLAAGKVAVAPTITLQPGNGGGLGGGLTRSDGKAGPASVKAGKPGKGASGIDTSSISKGNQKMAGGGAAPRAKFDVELDLGGKNRVHEVKELTGYDYYVEPDFAAQDCRRAILVLLRTIMLLVPGERGRWERASA